MSVSSIGPLVSRQNVEQAYLTLIPTWLTSTYLLEVAAQNSLPVALTVPPAPESYYGGVDTQSWTEALLPAVVVTAQPTGDAELRGSGDYSQWFEVQVAALVESDGENPEDDARELADWYGAALMGVIVQNGDLNGFAVQTLMIEPPRADFVDEDRREFAMSVGVYHTLIDSVVNNSGGPAEPGWPPPAVPIAKTPGLTVTAVPVDEPT